MIPKDLSTFWDHGSGLGSIIPDDRMSTLKPLSVLLPLLLTAAPALADDIKAVPSGVDQQIDFFASINPDCSSIGIPTVRLVDGPYKGMITTDKGRDFKTFPRGNPRHVCNRKRVAGLKLFYKSQKGFLGTDRVHILILSGSGTGRDETYNIQVR
jgi:hypothetical protein